MRTENDSMPFQCFYRVTNGENSNYNDRSDTMITFSCLITQHTKVALQHHQFLRKLRTICYSFIQNLDMDINFFSFLSAYDALYRLSLSLPSSSQRSVSFHAENYIRRPLARKLNSSVGFLHMVYSIFVCCFPFFPEKYSRSRILQYTQCTQLKLYSCGFVWLNR